MRIFRTICLLILAVSCSSPEIKVNKVTFLDNNFVQIKVVEKTNELNDLIQHWKDLRSIERPSNIMWTHKIDIDSEQIGGRWLYNSENGHLSILSAKLTPYYQVKNVSKFNGIFLSN